MSFTLATHSAEETQQLARRLAEALQRGPLLLLLSGDYGTGKTTFIQGLAAGLGIVQTLRSPSYLLARQYAGRLPLVHADLYRTHSAAEVQELGLDELAGPEGIIAVEWPGSVARLALRGWPMLQLNFTADPAVVDLRHIEAHWDAACPAGLLEVLHAAAAG